MPAVLNPQDIPDLVNLTHDTMFRNKTWIDLSLTKQRHTITDRFFKGKKLPQKSGPLVIWKLQKSNTRNFRWVGLFNEDTYDVRSDLTGSGSQSWAMCTTNYSFDVNEADFQSDDPNVLVENIKVREHAMYNDWFENLEDAFWGAPTAPPSGTNPGVLCGIPFWIQKSATTGFTGGDPSGFSSGAGGITVASTPNWANYNDVYAAINRDDFISKLRRATEWCNFIPPHQYPTHRDGDPRYVLYTTWGVLEGSAKYLDSRADNIRDLNGNGNPMFNSISLERVPALDMDDSDNYDDTDPLYGVDWNAMKMYFCSGRDMVRTPPQRRTGMHNVYDTHVDSTVQMVNLDRRSSFVLHR